MKKLFTAFLIAFASVFVCTFAAVSLIGYDNFAVMQQKHLLTLEMAAAHSQLWAKYGTTMIICYVPTFAAFANLGFQFWRFFNNDN